MGQGIYISIEKVQRVPQKVQIPKKRRTYALFEVKEREPEINMYGIVHVHNYIICT